MAWTQKTRTSRDGDEWMRRSTYLGRSGGGGQIIYPVLSRRVETWGKLQQVLAEEMTDSRREGTEDD